MRCPLPVVDFRSLGASMSFDKVWWWIQRRSALSQIDRIRWIGVANTTRVDRLNPPPKSAGRLRLSALLRAWPAPLATVGKVAGVLQIGVHIHELLDLRR